MSEESKIVIFSAIIVFALSSIYVIIGASMVNFTYLAKQANSSQTDLVQLNKYYQLSAKKIVDEYSSMQTDLKADKIAVLRQSLLALTVPAKFKNLHYSLVFAMDELYDYTINGDSSKKQASQEKIAEAKKDYGWLN
jgi:hypothetical protein